MEIAICDDEKEIREQLKRLVEERRPDVSLTCYASGEALLDAGKRFDMVFLDIRMDGKDGIETARILRKADEDLLLIFITGLKEYVFDAFDVGAFHYLLKPISGEKFAQVFEAAARKVEKKHKQETFLIRNRNRNVLLRKDHILYVESRMRKAEIHTCRGNYEIYGTMQALEKQLGGNFYRCHRGYLVNLAHVLEYTTDSITLTGGMKIFLSREKYNAFVRAYMRYLQNGGISYV